MLAAATSLRTELSDEHRSTSLGRAALTAIGCTGSMWLALTTLFGALTLWQALGNVGGAVFAAVGATALVTSSWRHASASAARRSSPSSRAGTSPPR